MNRDDDEEKPTPNNIDDVPRSLRRAGLRIIVSNLGEDQTVRLPKGLIVTFFKRELMEALTKHAKETQAKKIETEITQSELGSHIYRHRAKTKRPRRTRGRFVL